MAFPVVEAVARGARASNATSSTVTMPATVNAGDRLIVILGTDGSGGHSASNALAQTFAELYDQSNSTVVRGSVWSKVADGSEGGQDAVFAHGNEMAAWHVYRISGASPIAAPFVGPDAQATSSAPSAPDCAAPWGAADNLWIPFVVIDSNDADVTAHPSGYEANGIYDEADDTNGCGLGSSYRALNAAAEDVTPWTLASSEQWKCATICVAPANATLPPLRRSVATAESATVSKPSGVVEGDLLIACVARFNSTTPPSLPTGWTNINNDAHVSFSASFRICYKIAGDSEPSSYTFTNAQTSNIAAYLAGTFDPANPVGPGSFNSSGGSTTITAAGVTTEADDALLAAYLSHGASLPSSNHGFSNVSGFGVDTSYWEALQESAGASGNKTWSVASTPWHAQLFSINAAPPPPAPSARPSFHAQLIG